MHSLHIFHTQGPDKSLPSTMGKNPGKKEKTTRKQVHRGPHAPGTALVLSAGLQTWSRAPEASASWGQYTTWACRTGGLQNANGPACSSWDLPHRQSTHRPSGTGLALSVKIA